MLLVQLKKKLIKMFMCIYAQDYIYYRMILREIVNSVAPYDFLRHSCSLSLPGLPGFPSLKNAAHPFSHQITCTLLFPCALLPLYPAFVWQCLKGVPFPIAVIRSFVCCIPLSITSQRRYPGNGPAVSFSGFCRYSRICTPIWRFAVRSPRRERTSDICFSESRLPHSIGSFLVPFICLQSLWLIDLYN